MTFKMTHSWHVKLSEHSKKKLAVTIVKKTMMMLQEEESEPVQRKSTPTRLKWMMRKSKGGSMP